MMQPNLYNATDYANWQLTFRSAVTAVAMQATLNAGYVTIKGRPVNPLKAAAVVTVDNLAANTENIALTSVVSPGQPPANRLKVLATWTKAHGIGTIVHSATFGLQEAVNDAINQGGGLVIIDNTWPGPSGSGTITGLAVGSTLVAIQDIRGGALNVYTWGGAAYALTAQPGAVLWGGITGTLSNQTDLQTALNLLAPKASPTFTGNIIESTPSVPATAAAAGVAGSIAWDTGFIYVCTATNTWKRVAIATW